MKVFFTTIAKQVISVRSGDRDDRDVRDWKNLESVQRAGLHCIPRRTSKFVGAQMRRKWCLCPVPSLHSTIIKWH